MQAIINLHNANTGVTSTVVVQDGLESDISVGFPKDSGTLLTTNQLEANVQSASESVANNIFSIVKPTFIAPSEGALGFLGTIFTSPYKTINSFIGEHTATDWYFSTTLDFSNAIVITNDTENLVSYPFVPEHNNAKYYVKVRYRSGHILSEFSDVLSFTSAIGYPNKPVISVTDDSYKNTLKPNITIDPLVINGDGDVLEKVDIEVATDAKFKNLVFKSYGDKVNLTGFQIITGIVANTTYFVRVKQYGNKYETLWSDTLSFLSGSKTSKPTLTGNTAAVEGSTLVVTISNYVNTNGYNITVDGGTFTRTDDKIYWKLPRVLVSSAYKLGIVAKDIAGGLSVSDAVSFNVNVSNISFTTDQGLLYNISNLRNSFKVEDPRFINGGDNKGLNELRYMAVSDVIPSDDGAGALVNTTTKVYINNMLYTPVVGDKLMTEYGEEFEVGSVTLGEVVNLSDIVKVAAGYRHTLILKSNGDLYGCGDNQKGQLGLASVVTTVDKFTLLRTGVTDIYAGDNHSLIITTDVKYFVTGDNTYGQLALGDTVNRYGFTELVVTDITQIVAVGNNTAALKANGTVWSAGMNSTGECGINTVPKLELREVEFNASGTFTVPSDAYNNEFYVGCTGGGGGRVSLNIAAYGSGGSGRTSGTFTLTPGQQIPVVVGRGGLEGELAGQSSTFGSLLTCLGGNGGYRSSAGLGVSGGGDGGPWYQSGTASNCPAMFTLKAGAIDNTKGLYKAKSYPSYDAVGAVGGDGGAGCYGNIGPNTGSGVNGSDTTGCSGKVVVYYYVNVGDTAANGGIKSLTASNLTGILSLGKSGRRIVGINASGIVFAGWSVAGYTWSGQEVTNAKVSIAITNVTDVSVGNKHALILKSDGTVSAIGYNDYGQIGKSGVIDTAGAIVALSVSNIKKIVVNGDFSYLIANDNTVYSAGLNTDYQLGQEVRDTQVTTFTKTVFKAKDIACGNDYVIGIDTNNDLLAYGNNARYKLGYRTNNRLGSGLGGRKFYPKTPNRYYPNTYITPKVELSKAPDAVYLKKSIFTSELITQDAGDNNFSGVNTGGMKEFTSNVIDTVNASTGLKLYVDNRYADLEVGQQLVTANNEVITVGKVEDDGVVSSISNVKTLVAGYHNFFAIKENNELWAIGRNDFSQLGIKGSKTIDEWTYTGVKVLKVSSCWGASMCIREDNMVLSVGFNQYGMLGLGDSSSRDEWTETNFYAKDIACGVTHALALNMSGLLYAVGDNTRGQLGLGTYSSKVNWTPCTNSQDVYALADKIFTDNNTSFVIRIDGLVYSCGENTNGQLGVSSTDATKNIFTSTTVKAVDIAPGTWHTLLLKSDGSVFGCGASNLGQLGIGNVGNKLTFTDLGIKGSKIDAGPYSSVVKKLDGSLVFSGANNYYQAGNSSQENIFTWFTLPIASARLLAISTYSMIWFDNDNVLYGTGDNSYEQLGKVESVYCAKPAKLLVHKPFLGSYKPNYWIIPETPLTNVPTALYPITSVYFNNTKANVKRAVYENNIITSEFDNVEFTDGNTLTTVLDVPYTNTVYEVSGSIQKLS